MNPNDLQASCVFDPQRSTDNTSPVILSPLHPASLMHKNSQGCRIIILKACADQSKKLLLKNALFAWFHLVGGGGGLWAQLNLTDG